MTLPLRFMASFIVSAVAIACSPAPARAPVIVVPPKADSHAQDVDTTTPASCEDVDAHIAAVERLVPTLSVRRHVQGEDATSGFINELRARGGDVLRVRTAWNGGCCNQAEITDVYLRDGKVIAIIDSVADTVDGDAVLHGKDPATKFTRARRMFCGSAIDITARDEAQRSVRDLIEDIDAPHD